MSEELRQILAEAFGSVGSELAVAAVALLAFGLPLALAGYVLLKRAATKHGVDLSVQWRLDGKAPDGSPLDVDAGWRDATAQALPRPQFGRAPDDSANAPQLPGWLRTLDHIQKFLESLYKLMVMLGAFALAVGAFFAFRYHTPGNGLALVGLILSALALIVFLSADKRDRQKREAEAFGDVVGSLLRNVKISTVHAPPEVMRLDRRDLDAAKRMKNEGAAMDDICRTVERDYAHWDSWKQDAFRRMLQAALNAEDRRSST
jgi:hypothetical protein